MQGDEPQDVPLDPRIRELKLAQKLSSECEWERAYDIAYKWLKSDPNDPQALNIIAYIMLNTDKCAIAYPILRHLVTLEPTDSLAWLNMGMACSDLWRYNEAVRAYKKGIHHAPNDREKSMQCVNMSSVMVDHGDFVNAEIWAKKAIDLEPESIKGHANLGFAQLANRKWIPGWRNYRYCIDSEWRPITQYNDEPLWSGEKGTICIYSEQGLGDEISFGQMLIDMDQWCKENDSRLIVDVNPRLENLFKRSFPDLEIHGTRGQRQINWDPRDIEYSLPMAQLGEYFRLHDNDFNGKPYLKADPDRVLQWKALFDSKNKPVIGLGWMSGIWKTGAKNRQMSLEQLLPLLESVDAHWVSLQYKPAGKQIAAFKEEHPHIDIVEYSHGTLTQDYDDTTSLIAALDMVLAIQTTAVHVAGGLGVPCWCFVPQTSQWRYGQETEEFLWADSVRILRQQERGQWDSVIADTALELKKRFPQLEAVSANN